MPMPKTNPFGQPLAHLPAPKVYRTPYKLQKPPVKVDPITYEIISHRFTHVGLTMGETLKKVSGTIVTAEANDMSTFITLEDGAPAFIGPYVILHAAIADLIVTNVMKVNKDDPGIKEGDMFLCNDPWMGIVHQPDCSIIQPIFVDGKLFLWTGITVHQLDMGGISPGGVCPDAKDIYAEPHLYPGIKIVENGSLRADIDRMLQRNSRMPGIVALDIRSMLAGNGAAREGLMKIVKQYGPEVVKSVLIMMQNKTSEKFKARLKKLPRGKFRWVDRYEIGGTAPEVQDMVYDVHCTLTNTGRKLIFDFSGTSPQSEGFTNCGFGGMYSGLIAGLVGPVAYDLPWNAGLFVNLEIISQEGTIHNPLFPAAVSDGITESSIVTGAACSGAVTQMVLGNEEMRKISLSTSGSNFLGSTMGGMTKEGKMWGTLLMDPIAMASMPTETKDGNDVTGSDGIPYTQYSNVETNELHYPLLYLYRRVGKPSFGHGYRHGGRALEFCLKPHKTPIIMLLLWNHGAEFPNCVGQSGGLPASGAKFKLARATNIMDKFKSGAIPSDIDEFSAENLVAKGQNYVGEQDLLYFGIPGGYGYGDPLLREEELVEKDVKVCFVSVEEAKQFYGVVCNEAGNVDYEGTKAQREKIREERLKMSAFPHEWQEFEPGKMSAPSNGEKKPQATAPQGNCSFLFSVGTSLNVCLSEDRKFLWCCKGCGHVYCEANENLKLHAKLRVGSLNEFAHPTAQMTRINRPRFFFRQFFCPSCALCFACEVARKTDPIIFLQEYDESWLKEMTKNVRP